jgi:hypothetical protein
MTTRLPPRLATWLLERFGNGRRNESLIGDLHEQFAQGRSVGWYWSQVLRALAISVRVRVLTLVAAVASAFVLAQVWLLSHALFTRNAGTVHRFMSGMTDEYRTAAVLTWSVGVSIRMLFFFFAGWLAVRIHRSNPKTILALLVALYFLFPMRTRSIVPPVGQTALLIAIYAGGIGCLLLGGLVSMYMTRLDRRT